MSSVFDGNLSLQPMLDVPIYGRIATLELFRPHVRKLKAYVFFELLSTVVVLFFHNVFFLFVCFGFKQGEAQDYLFIATERYKFCVLQWDSETAELVTRYV